MDLVSSIIGVVVILACIIPFIIMSRNRKKRERDLLQEFSALAKQNNGTITRHDLWNSSIIGIDDNARMLFFLSDKNGTKSAEQVDLNLVQRCSLMNSSRTVSSKEGNYKVIERVELHLLYHNKGKKATVLEFYDVSSGNFTLAGELQLATKWSNTINEALSIESK